MPEAYSHALTASREHVALPLTMATVSPWAFSDNAAMRRLRPHDPHDDERRSAGN
jgi:hypothetical protein